MRVDQRRVVGLPPAKTEIEAPNASQGVVDQQDLLMMRPVEPGRSVWAFLRSHLRDQLGNACRVDVRDVSSPAGHVIRVTHDGDVLVQVLEVVLGMAGGNQ